MGAVASALKGLKDAEPNRKDPYFTAGNYKVAIVETKVFESKRNRKVMFIIRAKIVESNVADRPAGMVCAQIITITGNDSGMGNIKTFIAAATGADMDDTKAMAEINENTVEEIVEKNALEGLVMRLECTMTTTKKGDPFTVHTWGSVED